jgi:fermentation-respiration switch protein FrsA (DUF1100 family)
VAAIGVLLVYSACWFLSRPRPQNVGAPPPDFNGEPIEFSSESGSMIHGWLCKVPNSRGYALLLPGVRANRSSMIDRARFLRREGFSCLLIDFQATGESRGEHITFGYLESRDAVAAVRFLHTVSEGKPIIVLGTSLGGAAAVLAQPALPVQAAILEEVYPAIDKATDNRLRSRLGPLATIGTPILLHQLRQQLGIGPETLRPIDHIGALHCPVLIIGGGADRYTSPKDTYALYARANEPKQLWLVPGAAHVDLYAAAKEEYERRVASFLHAALRD